MAYKVSLGYLKSIEVSIENDEKHHTQIAQSDCYVPPNQTEIRVRVNGGELQSIKLNENKPNRIPMLHPLTVTVNMAPICSGLEPRSTLRLFCLLVFL